MKKRILSLSIVMGIVLSVGIYSFNANNTFNNETTNSGLLAYDTSVLRLVGDPGEGLPK